MVYAEFSLKIMLIISHICRYSSVEQKFSLCAQPSEPGPNGCNHIGLRELVTGPLVFYLVWMLLYILVVSTCNTFMHILLILHLSITGASVEEREGKEEELCHQCYLDDREH